MTDFKNGVLQINSLDINIDMTAEELIDGLKKLNINFEKYPADSDTIRSIRIPKVKIDGLNYSVTVRYLEGQKILMEEIVLFHLPDILGKYDIENERLINENLLRQHIGEPHAIKHQAVYYYYDRLDIIASYFHGLDRGDEWRCSLEITIRIKHNLNK